MGTADAVMCLQSVAAHLVLATTMLWRLWRCRISWNSEEAVWQGTGGTAMGQQSRPFAREKEK